MQQKEITGIILSTYQDQILGYTYLQVLTDEALESFKLSGRLDNISFGYRLTPANLLTFETIKTNKNWIFKDLLNSKSLCAPKKWSDYQWLLEVSKIFIYYSKDTQPTKHLFEYYQILMSSDFLLNISTVEKKLLEISGFSILENKHQSINQIKNASGLL